MTRPWWSIKTCLDQNFLRNNLVRLLLNADLFDEAVSVVTDGRWAKVRIQQSKSVAYFNSDIESVIRFSTSTGFDPVPALRIIQDASLDMELSVLGDITELPSQVHGRLRGIDDRLGLLARFMATVGDVPETHWLCPLYRQWPGPFGHRLIRIPVDVVASGLAVDWKSQTVFITARYSISEIDLHARTRSMNSCNLPSRVLAISKNGDYVAIECGENGAIVFDRSNLDTPRFEKKEIFKGEVRAAAWSPDGRKLVLGGFNIRSENGNISRGSIASLDCKTGALDMTLESAHRKAVLSVASNQCGNIIASGSADGCVKVWDVGKILLTRERLDAHPPGVAFLCMSSNGTLVASAGVDGTVRLWKESRNGKSFVERDAFRLSDQPPALDLSKDGKRLVAGDEKGNLEIRDVCSNQVIFTACETSFSVRVVAISPDGEDFVAAGSDGYVLFVKNSSNVDILESSRAHAHAVIDVSFVDNGNSVLSKGKEGFKLWNVHDGLVRPLPYVPCDDNLTAISEDGTLAVTASLDSPFVTWWDTHSWKEISRKSLPHNGNGVNALEVNKNGSRVVTFSQDGLLCLWDGLGRQLVTTKPNIEICRPAKASLSGDGMRLVLASFHDLMFWDCPSEKMKSPEFHRGKSVITAIATSHDGALVLCGDCNGTLRVFRWQTKQVIWDDKGICSDGWILNVSMSMDGRRMFSTSEDKQLKMWDARQTVEEEQMVDEEGFPESLEGIGRPLYNLVASVSLPDDPTCMAYCEGAEEERMEQVVVGDGKGNILVFKVMNK